ncbi:MAG: TlpA family protein disulfide reductase [Myxococcales bacterium]|nr:TlpA family protein disulfide reductase [Myxococcales bacterium]
MRAAVLISILAGACARPTPAPTAVAAAQAPPLPALSYPLRDGGTWRSADTLGTVAVIDVWASYCKPCRKSFPHLNQLAEDPTVAVLGLSVDEDDAAVTAFLAEIPARFPIARDRTQSVEDAPLAITKLPTVLVVDAAGRVRLRLEEPRETDYASLPAVIASIR